MISLNDRPTGLFPINIVMDVVVVEVNEVEHRHFLIRVPGKKTDRLLRISFCRIHRYNERTNERVDRVSFINYDKIDTLPWATGA